jgi:competence protein ComFC
MSILANKIQGYLSPVLEVFYPTLCIHCESKMYTKTVVSLCSSCEIQLESAFETQKINKSLEERTKGVVNLSFGFANYYFIEDGVSQSLMHEAKYRKHTFLLEHFGKVLGEKVVKTNFFEGETPDFIIPVPNHWFKRWRKGFNQAAVFGLAFGNVCKLRLENDALKKVSFTRSQTKKTLKQRLTTLSSAYDLGKNSHLIAGKHVLLVDDVITTGATIDVCTKLLLKAGASKVSVVAFMIVR